EAALDEKRRLVTSQRLVLALELARTLEGRSDDPRVGDAFQLLARFGVGEHARRQLLAIERAISFEDVGAEGRDDLLERRTARFDDLARELVGIDDRKTSRLPVRSHRALAGSEPPRQPEENESHVDSHSRTFGATLSAGFRAWRSVRTPNQV